MVKNLPATAGDREMSLGQSLGSISGSGKSPGVGKGTPFQLFLPEKSHGQKSLAGYRPWGGKESDTTELPSTAQWIAHQILYLFLSSCVLQLVSNTFSDSTISCAILDLKVLCFNLCVNFRLE